MWLKIIDSIHNSKCFEGCFTIVLVVTLALACANPFTTREPETPEQNNSTFLNPSAPDVVFINLRNALIERNVENYIRSFVDSSRSRRRFVFVPDQGVANTYSSVFLNWNLDSERNYLEKLLQATPADSLINLRFFDQKTISIDATTIEILQNYILIVHHTQSSKGINRTTSGQAIFAIEQDESGNWAIYRWDDFNQGAEEQSWSELKVKFR